jgi:5-oxoprolinase (ATP-hydrolysing) subunit C
MSLIVLEPGIESRIVDLGRPGTRSLGIPVGGAADRRSLILGNSLIGNPPDAAALEIALKGPRLRADADVGCVLFGAPFEARRDTIWSLWEKNWFDTPTMPGLSSEYRSTESEGVAAGHSFTLPAGGELEIRGTVAGSRAYLCVRGGFDVPTILASRSGLAPISKGESLKCAPSNIDVRYCPDSQGDYPSAWTVAVLPGLQASWFDEREFFNQTFTVTPASNRMGLRLSGKPLTLPQKEIISEPVCPGSIQVTRDGQCIILGVDGQTIGGYPKIAQVIQADLDSLGQMRPGQSICFTRISLEDALRRDREAQAKLRAWSLRLRLALDAH